MASAEELCLNVALSVPPLTAAAFANYSRLTVVAVKVSATHRSLSLCVPP